MNALSLARRASVLAALALTACETTLPAVNPHPTVVVPASSAAWTLDASRVKDAQAFSNVNVADFRTTLENGFRNATGSKYAKAGTKNAGRLVIHSADLGIANIGEVVRYMNLKYHATWYDSNGKQLAELAGIAEPRNPTETGDRHFEDVVEVMYEQMVGALEKAQCPAGAGNPSTVSTTAAPPPTSAAPAAASPATPSVSPAAAVAR